MTYFGVPRGNGSPEHVSIHGANILTDKGWTISIQAYLKTHRIEGYCGWGLSYPSSIEADRVIG